MITIYLMKGDVPVKEWGDYTRTQDAINEMLRITETKSEVLEMYSKEELKSIHVEIIVNKKCICTKFINKKLI